MELLLATRLTAYVLTTAERHVFKLISNSFGVNFYGSYLRQHLSTVSSEEAGLNMTKNGLGVFTAKLSSECCRVRYIIGVQVVSGESITGDSVSFMRRNTTRIEVYYCQ